MAGLVAVASAFIFAIRYVKPEASREYDIIFASMGLIYSLCLLLEGQRLIPLLFFAQVLVVAVGGFFAVETFRLRIQLVEKSRQVQGKTRRREGFTRTYRPQPYEEGRTVARSRRPDIQIQDASDSDRPAKRRPSPPPPQLEADTSTRSRRRSASEEDDDQDWDSPPPSSKRRPSPPSSDPPPRRRPPQLPNEDELPQRVIQVEAIEEEDYPDEER